MRSTFVLLAILLCLPAPVSCNPLAYRPVQESGDKNKSASGGQGSWFVRGIRFYQNNLSPIDGDRCPSFPSCSAYALHAAQKHGVLWGFWMTVDRLIHERSEIFLGKLVQRENGRYLVQDTLEMNNFWLD